MWQLATGFETRSGNQSLRLAPDGVNNTLLTIPSRRIELGYFSLFKNNKFIKAIAIKFFYAE